MFAKGKNINNNKGDKKNKTNFGCQEYTYTPDLI